MVKTESISKPWGSIFQGSRELSSAVFREDALPGHLGGCDTDHDCFRKHTKSPRTAFAVAGVCRTGMLWRVLGRRYALRGHCRAEPMGVCRGDRGSHPFFADGHSTEDWSVQRQQAAWWQRDEVLKGSVGLYISKTVLRGQPTLRFSLHGNRNPKSRPSDHHSSVSQ